MLTRCFCLPGAVGDYLCIRRNCIAARSGLPRRPLHDAARHRRKRGAIRALPVLCDGDRPTALCRPAFMHLRKNDLVRLIQGDNRSFLPCFSGFMGDWMRFTGAFPISVPVEPRRCVLRCEYGLGEEASCPVSPGDRNRMTGAPCSCCMD